MNADQLIDSIDFVKRDANREYCQACIPMASNDYRELVGSEFVRFFTANPEGETNRYAWTTKRVDQLVNLKIWSIA